MDALLSRRGEAEHDAMRRLKNEFLSSFDGVSVMHVVGLKCEGEGYVWMEECDGKEG